MEPLQTRNGVEGSEARTFNTFDAVGRKKQEQPHVMFEGKNIHSSPIDGKYLCSYSEKVCKQRRLNGYAFCIRHVLEDKNAPFKQCQFVAKYNGQQCTNPIPLAEDRIYCNSHLQVLGIVPKKNRKKKPSETHESNANSLPNSAETNFKLDGVIMTHHTTSMGFVPPMVVPFHRKKTKLHLETKEVSIPAVYELKERHKQFQRDRHNLFSAYGVESSDSDSSSASGEVPWQESWLLSDEDSDNTPAHEEADSSEEHKAVKQESDPRTIKLSKLSSRLRRELHQLRRSLRAHHHKHRELSCSIAALLKATRANPAASVEAVVGDHKLGKCFRREKLQPATLRKCVTPQCNQKALPYTRFCSDHIIGDANQVLYANCTAKFPGGSQCSIPVFDIIHERPLCEEHARKKEKFQEAQAQAQAAAAAAKTNGVTIKQPAKKPRRKPQPRLTPTQRPSKPTKKTQRKPASRSNKAAKAAKLAELANSFSADNLALSSDYSHTTEPSPTSPRLEDFQQFDTPLFDSQQQDDLMLQPTVEVEESEPTDIIPDSIPIQRNGLNSNDQLFHNANVKTSHIGSWPVSGSVRTSVITSPQIAKRMGPPVLISNHKLLAAGVETKMKPSPLNSKPRASKPRTAKPRETKSREPKTRETKSRETKRGQSKIFRPTYSIENIIASSLSQNNIDSVERSSPNHLTLNQDPMFSPPQGVLANNSSSNLNSEHLHSPARVGVSMDGILSPTQRSWTGIITPTAPASYTSPLNSQASSRITSPPFSPTSVSPHIVSPHRPSMGSVFTFDRPPVSQLLHSSVTSPRLGPLSPYMQASQVKQSLTFARQQDELDHRQNSDNDPFLVPLIDKEQSVFGHHFHQNSDPSLGDLRLR